LKEPRKKVGRPSDGEMATARSNSRLQDRRGHRSEYFLLAIFIALAGGIITVGISTFRSYSRNYRIGIERQLFSIAELKAAELTQWRRERMSDAESIFGNEAFSELAARWKGTLGDPESARLLRSWINRVREAYRYDCAAWIDPAGLVRESFPETSEPVSPGLIRDALAVLSSRRPAILDFRRDGPGLPVYLAVAVPIIEGADSKPPLGILVFRIDPSVFLNPLLQQWPTPSRTAETLLVRREGDDVLFLNELKFQSHTALNLKFPLSDSRLLGVRAARGEQGIAEGLDYRGVPVIGYVRGVPESPWFLVTRMDIAEALSPLRLRLWLMIGFITAILLGAGAGFGLVWRQQRANYFRARLEATQRLHAVSSRQEALLSATPDIIMEVDANRVYVWANRPGLIFFGEDVIGKEAAYYFEGEQETYHTVQPLFNGLEDVIYVESWQRRKDGEKRLLAWSCRVLKDSAGNVVGAISSARDITEQTRVAEAWRESERKFRETVKFLDEGYYSASPEGLLLDHNPAFNRILGLDPDLDMKGRALPDFWQNPEDRKPYVAELMAKGSIRNYLIKAKTAGGERVVVLANSHLVKDEKAGLVRIDGSFIDFTDREKAEEMILASEERFRNVFEHAAVGKSMTHIDGTMLVNDAFCRILGYSREELAKLKWPDITHPDDRARDQKFIDSIVSGEAPGADWQKRYIRRNGKTVWANISTVLQRDPAGKPQYFITTITDITEMKRQEQELREKNAELTRFTYAVSHDLKSPLVTIKTFLGYLEQDTGKADRRAVASDLMYIRNATDKMSRLLDELLELSRVGRKTNPAVEVSLQAVVREALHLVAGRIAERGVHVDVTRVPLILTGDRPRLVEVFQNLVDNAVKFMGDQPAPHIEIGVVEEGPEPVLFVRDNGIGIDSRYQSRLFGLFEKLDPGTEGTGIGLALVHRIVEVHGGKIRMESAGSGQGSTFYFTLAKTKKQPRPGGSE
jgi:PAS domain S-box-containing protein